MNRAFFLTLLLLFSTTSFAWNAMGHRVIAEIAYDKLDPVAKAESMQLISYLADAYPYNSSFQTASSWADAIKQDDVHSFDTWHFYDEPLSTDNTPTDPLTTPNLLWAINQCITILKNNNSNQFEKAFFLRFLLHLVGDAHQPLHCVDRYSKQFPHGDQGGNLYPIQNSQYPNLHAYWDDGLGYFDENCHFSVSKSRQADCLAHRIENDFPEDHMQQQAHDLNPQDWINESFNIDKTFVYTTPENRALSDNYCNKGQQIVEQQLALAGYRLANLLNSIFG